MIIILWSLVAILLISAVMQFYFGIALYLKPVEIGANFGLKIQLNNEEKFLTGFSGKLLIQFGILTLFTCVFLIQRNSAGLWLALFSAVALISGGFINYFKSYQLKFLLVDGLRGVIILSLLIPLWLPLENGAF